MSLKQFRGVAQLVAHLVWDQGVAGSNPVTPTTLRIVYLLTGRALGKLKIVIRGVAQLVAHLVWDQGVAGSNPVTPTKTLTNCESFFVFILF